MIRKENPKDIESIANQQLNYMHSNINDKLQKRIDYDIDKTQKAIIDGCEMLSVKESYKELKEKYDF